MKKLFKNKKIFTLSLFGALGVVGVVIAGVKTLAINPTDTYSSTSIEFLYDGASSGLSPKGDKISLDAIKSDAVIEKALKEASLDSKYSVDEIKENLIVTGSYSKDLIEKINGYSSILDQTGEMNIAKNDIYPTKFNITLYQGDTKLSKVELNTLLTSLVKEYESYFFNAYQYSCDFSSYDELIENNSDYNQKVNAIELKASIIKKYANSLYTDKPLFTYNDQSFDKVVLQCDNLINQDLSKIDAYISLAGVSIDPDLLINSYKIQIRSIDLSLNELNRDLTNVNDTINGYTRDSDLYVTSGDTITVIKGNSSETYQNLVAKKVNLTDSIASLTAEKAKYEQLVDVLENSSTNSAATQAVKDYVALAEQRLTSIEESFNTLLKEYNKEYINEDIVVTTKVSTTSASLISGKFIKECIKCVGPFYMLAIIFLLSKELIDRLTKKA